MAALHHGQYTTVPAETPIQGVKRVDIDALYDVEQYRPSVREILGTPMFLY
jgi:6-phosphofructokinase 1